MIDTTNDFSESRRGDRVAGMSPHPSVVGPTGGQRFARGMRRGFLFFFLALVALGGLAIYLLMNVSYSDGYRVGTIQKISKKGVFFKSYEGELAQGFLDANPEMDGGVATRTFSFSVPAGSDEVLASIDRAIEHNRRVKLYYEERYRTLPWVGDTKYVVTKVEEIGGQPAQYPATQDGTVNPPPAAAPGTR
jgi:hypothetical protein